MEPTTGQAPCEKAQYTNRRRFWTALAASFSSRVSIASFYCIIVSATVVRVSSFSSCSPFVRQGRSTIPPSFQRQPNIPFAIPWSEADAAVNSPEDTRSLYLRWKPQLEPASTAASSSSSSLPTEFQAPSSWEMQTGVTRFERTVTTSTTTKSGETMANTITEVVELHAQLHFGDESYFDYYNSRAFQKKKDAILYELLVDEHLLQPSPELASHLYSLAPYSGDTDTWSSPIMAASPYDDALAQRYGWVSQVNAIHYGQPRWIHADFTRQEFLRRLEQKQNRNSEVGTDEKEQYQQRQQPLWIRATDSRSSWPEAATALMVGPPPAVLSGASSFAVSSERPSEAATRQIFSALRAALWLTVPLPELSILLLDGASLFVSVSDDDEQESRDLTLPPRRVASSSRSRSARRAQPAARWSLPITLSLIQALVMGQWRAMQQLFFGQVVLSGMMTSRETRRKPSTMKDRSGSVLIDQRNQRAMHVLNETLLCLRKQNRNQTNVALLYGCQHCPGLHQMLVQEGFLPVSNIWRTVWSVFMAPSSKSDGIHSNSNSSLLAAACLLVTAAYFALGGLDWIATWKGALESTDGTEILADASLYLVRHVMLYLFLSKYVFEWNDGRAV